MKYAIIALLGTLMSFGIAALPESIVDAHAGPDSTRAGAWMCSCPGGPVPLGNASNCNTVCGGGSYTPNVPRGPSPEEIRQKNSYEANEAGQRAFAQHDYETALQDFKESLRYEPGDPIVLSNLGKTYNNIGWDAYTRGDYEIALQDSKLGVKYDPHNSLHHINVARAEGKLGAAAANAGDYNTGLSYFRMAIGELPQYPRTDLSRYLRSTYKKIQLLIQQKQDAESAKATVSHDIDQLRTMESNEQPAGVVAGLGFVDSTRKGLFGTNVSKPTLTDLGPKTKLPIVKEPNALGQAESIAHSETEAAHTGSKALAGCGYDNPGCEKPEVNIKFGKALVQTPAAAALISHIPDKSLIKNNPVIRNALKEYDHLEMIKSGSELKLADIQKRIEKRDGDAKLLAARKATLQNNIRKDQSDQANMVRHIKKKLVDLGVAWVTSPSHSNASQAKNAH